ncbi:MAG: peptidylprolyl isomerase [Cobetia sp.]|jgi:FKBP-type peptidyl-prolyl cis-trans isomerase SlyD|uniref:Peptidyl-prolyl cis-trans isomerase n=1 Tax=Cobetia amphilecti TaxID=1055104 RepID=A0ABT6UMZ5_9GAMM|nr:MULTISPECIES: peptidylprolyl isomerase [Cobetia]MBR9753884.1 peptidylprolyl isomerase [Gammaproteobacteria bacterium]KGA02780.1 peptidylprolyl isomerase [Cobetia amphilecti]MBF07590.1 peptidylprolyl isomerase [Cobetia sp.]MBK08057.1 peptidylprolyl isomerase [Cobetia sp.]MBR9797499.1 peptidylprolyl isomerase [Gammaproteobacteria bacterium]|tara:strand:+ start:1245 stop:1751 length:507 start_codon:yes stop_codon:yes gene_type:complete
MAITSQQVVSLHYTLRTADGTVLDSSLEREPMDYLHGHDNILAALESALEGCDVGDRKVVNLTPAEGFGERDEGLVQYFGRDAFGPGEINAGMRFQARTPEGQRSVTVLEVGEQQVKVDANHPLAGQALSWEVEVLEVRDATRAELSAGHPLGLDVSHTEIEDKKVRR